MDSYGNEKEDKNSQRYIVSIEEISEKNKSINSENNDLNVNEKHSLFDIITFIVSLMISAIFAYLVTK